MNRHTVHICSLVSQTLSKINLARKTNVHVCVCTCAWGVCVRSMHCTCMHFISPCYWICSLSVCVMKEEKHWMNISHAWTLHVHVHHVHEPLLTLHLTMWIFLSCIVYRPQRQWFNTPSEGNRKSWWLLSKFCIHNVHLWTHILDQLVVLLVFIACTCTCVYMCGQKCICSVSSYIHVCRYKYMYVSCALIL